MKPVLVPNMDVNSDSGVVVEWRIDDGAQVDAGQVIAEFETSKALLDVLAAEPGFLRHAIDVGVEIDLSQPIGFLFETKDELEAFVVEAKAQPGAQATEGTTVAATEPARKRAEELGIDLISLNASGLITIAQVEAAHAARAPSRDLPDPLPGRIDTRRLAIIGGGLGATQVLDILANDEAVTPVAVFDDKEALWAGDVMGVPIVGGRDRLRELFAEDAFDAAVISISTSVRARAQLRAYCERLDIPLANAIDPTVRVTTGVRLGTGNIICAFCHLGVETRVGDNNFISAYNSFDHHNVLGSDISTGPGCMTSGLVTIGDRVRLGTGIFVEPHVELGADVQVASGAIIVASVPPDHAVKRRVVTTTVLPTRHTSTS